MTGAIWVMALYKPASGDPSGARAWFCANPEQEDVVQERTGPIEPGVGLLHAASGNALAALSLALATPSFADPCVLTAAQIPDKWKTDFPSGEEIIHSTLQRMAAGASLPDERLIMRRECEYKLFLSVEFLLILPRISKGFASIDAFIDCANSVTNRRKSRSGKSLELHLKTIFSEEHLAFAHGVKSEGEKRPDFLFPSAAAYRDPSWPVTKLRMLGAKTTCKDRWRQILNEAVRVRSKHLVTLQEGVSVNQFKEMEHERITLVVPKSLHQSYPKSVRPKLVTLEHFIKETKLICGLRPA